MNSKDRLPHNLTRYGRQWRPGLAAAVLVLGLLLTATAQVGKANRILIERGLQLQGMVTPDDVFHLATYSNASFTSVNWLWNSSPALLGPAPGFPWSRWVADETRMPPQGNERPYLSQLISLQLADEWHLNDPAVRTRAVNWFNAVRTNWPNTILYANNWGGQVSDSALGDFITRAQPDMLCFDLYPFRSDYATRAPIGGPPTGWFGELRRYRAWALQFNIPFAAYRQTFHAVQDYDATVYRDPSPSELRLNTFGALAFNAKVLIDFTYNTGASALFTSPGGDSYPSALYAEQADINRRASNIGKALVCLKPIYELHNPSTLPAPPGPSSDDPNFPNGIVTSILFLRGKYLSGGVTNPTALPNSFVSDPQAPNSYSWWEFRKNDPLLTGWVVTNKAGIKNNGLPGEVIIAWFTPLDESFDGPDYTNEIYFMVVNALTDLTGSPADCLQEIKLNFLNSFTSVVMLDSLTGELHTNTLPLVNTRRQLVLNLNGGDAALFKISDGAPFVGKVTPQAARLSLTMPTNTPVVTVQGSVGARYQLQTSAFLPGSNWTVLTNLMLPSTNFMFIDSTSSPAGTGFYRAVGKH